MYFNQEELTALRCYFNISTLLDDDPSPDAKRLVLEPHQIEELDCSAYSEYAFFILLEGRIIESTIQKEGMLNVYGPYDLIRFDRFLGISDSPCFPLQVIGNTPVQLLAIPHEWTQGNALNHKLVLNWFVDQTAELERMTDLHEHLTVEDRIKWVFQKLLNIEGKRYGELSICITHRNLSEWINASRQTVTKILADWKREGRIDYKRESILFMEGWDTEMSLNNSYP